MPTIRLTASTYAVSNTSYLSVSDPSYMYNNTDNSSNYTTITNTYASTSSRYLYLRGFNFASIPINATVNSFTVKIKGYESGLATSTSYAPRLANGTSAISSTTASSNFGTTTKTITIPTGNLTWQQIDNYGSNFTIMCYVRRSNKNTTGYLYLYGAEIEVTYTLPVSHTVSITGDNVTPSGTQTVQEGDTLVIKCYGANRPTVTDNGVDVSSQLIQQTDNGKSYTVTNITTQYGFVMNEGSYYESNNKGVASSAAVCRVDFSLATAATVTFSVINYAEATYDYGLLSNVDTTLSTNASADTTNVYWNGGPNNSSSVQTVTYNMSSGDHYVYVKYFKDQYTDSNNDSLQFSVSITLTGSYTPQVYWQYTLTNITTDHTIVVSTAASKKVYMKTSSGWIQYSKIWIKTSNGWLELNDPSEAFDSDNIYIKVT